MSPIEIRIKETELPQCGLTVVTARWTDPTLLRPFETFVKGDLRWLPADENPSPPVTYFFAAEAATLHAHKQTVCQLTKAGVTGCECKVFVLVRIEAAAPRGRRDRKANLSSDHRTVNI